MDKKVLNLSRYKRMFKLTNDHSFMAKYAQESSADELPYTLPTVDDFLGHLVTANSKPLEGDVLQGQLSGVVARVLALHYKSTLDLDEPAIIDIKPTDDINKALSERITKFSRSELVDLQASVASAMRKLGDAHLSSLSTQLTREKLKDLIDFALSRAYVAQYWFFLFQNPIATVVLENETPPPVVPENEAPPLSVNSALTAHQIITADEDVTSDDEYYKYEPGPEDRIEEEFEGSYLPNVEKALEKNKENRRIQEFPGQKIRLSQLIEAFKLTRAKWGVRLVNEPDNPKVRMGWLATDANIDYLERAFESLKAFVAKNPNNRFLKWHGQRIGNGDVFVITTGSKFDTLKMMSPPPFKVGYEKVTTLDKDTGRTKREYNMQAVRIPVKHWNPDAEQTLNVFLPEFPDIYDYYAHQKLANPSAYQDEVRTKTFGDLQNLHNYNLSNGISDGSLMKDGKTYFQRRVLFDPSAPAPIDFGNNAGPNFNELGEPKLTTVCDLLWKDLHEQVTEVFSESSDIFEFEKLMKGVPEATVVKVRGNQNVSSYLREEPTIDNEAKVGFELVMREMSLPKSPSSVALGMASMSQIFAAPVTENDLDAQISKFANKKQGRRCQSYIEEMLRVEIITRDRELNFTPGGVNLRNPSEYQVILAKVHNDVYDKFAMYLQVTNNDATKIKNSSKNAIRLLVENLAKIMYPDAAAPVNPNKRPVDMRSRAEGLYHSGRQPDNYTQTQAHMLRDTLTGAHFENQFEFAEEEFDKIQLELSNREQKKRVYHEVESATSEIERRNKELGYQLIPNKPRKDILDEKVSHLFTKDGNIADMEMYQKGFSNAMVETFRLWLVDMMGPDDDPNEKIRELLGEQQSGNTLSMGLYSTIGHNIGMQLLPQIGQDTLKRFPGGGKRRGAVGRGAVGGGDDFTQPDDERANRMSLLGLTEIPKDCAGITEFDEKIGPPSHSLNLAEISARSMAMQASSEGDGTSIISQGKRAAEGEVENYLIDMLGPMRFKTVRTRKTRYETTEEARKKPRVALSTHTFGGFIQQLFQSKSPYLKEYLKDEKKFRNWFIVSAAASFGNDIGGRVDNRLRKLWGPGGKYESMEHLMESVGAFADPLWAATPWTDAFGDREMQKRKSGYIADDADTAEKHLSRAAYNIPSLDAGEAEVYLKHYFEKRAWQIRCGFNGADPKKVEEYLVRRYRRDPTVSRAENVTNNPFGKMDGEELRRIFGTVGITPTSLEQYFGRIKLEFEKAEKERLNYVSEYTRDDNIDDLIIQQKKFEASVEISSQYAIDGSRTRSNWVLDQIDKTGLGPSEKLLLEEAVELVKTGLDDLVGDDAVEYIRIFNDMNNWSEAVELILSKMDSRFDPIKEYIGDQLGFAKSQVALTEQLKKEHEEKMLAVDDEGVESIKEKEEEVKPPSTVVRRRKKPEEEEKATKEEVGDVGVTTSIPEFEQLALSLDTRVEVLRDVFFPPPPMDEDEDGFEPNVEFNSSDTQIDPSLLNEALINIQRYTTYLRSLRNKDVTGVIDKALIDNSSREISTMSGSSLVEKFTGMSYEEMVDKLKITFGISKTSKLIGTDKILLGTSCMSKDSEFDESPEYYHF